MLVVVTGAGRVSPLLLAAVGANVGVAWHAQLVGWDGITAMSVFFGQVRCANGDEVATTLLLHVCDHVRQHPSRVILLYTHMLSVQKAPCCLLLDVQRWLQCCVA